MKTTMQDAVSSFRQRLAALFFIRYYLFFSAVWLFVSGAGVLVLRIALGVPRGYLMWGLLGLAPAAIAALMMAFRRIPSREAALAKLDALNHCGGLLMSGAEATRWQSRLGAVRLPRLMWGLRRESAPALMGAVFLAGSLMAPHYSTGRDTNPRLALGQLVEEIDARIDVLEEEKLLDEQSAEELEEQLRNIWDKSSGRDPSRSWEALDHMEEQVEDKSREAAESLLPAVEKLAMAASLSEVMNSEHNLEPQAAEAAADALAELMQGLEKMSGLESNIDPQLLQHCRSAELSPEQIRELAKALKAGQIEALRKMQRLRDAKLLDEEMLKRCKACMDGANANLADYLSGNCSSTGAIAQIACRLPGQGGINRGRGDAPMTWRQETDESGLAFKEEMIQPSAFAEFEESRLLGVSASSPEESGEGGISAGGALSSTCAGGGAAVKRKVLPRHRSTVKRYFERKE
ncbi:MAG: hypothetical protein ACOC6C_00075 [Verrucomicrobiota bacterium]